MYEKVIKKSILISKLLREDCIKRICNIVKEKQYLPGELVFTIEE